MCLLPNTTDTQAATTHHILTPFLIPKSPTQEEDINVTESNHHYGVVVIQEVKWILQMVIPMILTGLLLYPRSMISMLFLGKLGDLALAGGSLAVSFSNITGYSVISGLAAGMEPICGQAFGAGKPLTLGVSLQKTILLLAAASIPISFLWFNTYFILCFFGQDHKIAAAAQTYLICSIPDLLAQSILHPLEIYLRAQSLTFPLVFCAAIASIFHIPINYLLVTRLEMGIQGVAFGNVWTNCNLVVSLILYISISGVYKKTWDGRISECLRGWKALMDMAIPSCISICLEWWWYEIMILLCGLLANPQTKISSMGILIQTTSLIYIFPSSLGSGVSTRVSNELGANHPTRAKISAVIGIFGSFLLGFVALAFAIGMKGIWARMFTSDAEIIALTSAVLPILGLCELGNCPQTVGCGVLRGTARPKVGAGINLGCFYLLGMPVTAVLGFMLRFDFMGLWLGLLAAQGACAVTMLFVICRTDWEFQARRAAQLTATNENEDKDNEWKEDPHSNNSAV